MSEMVKKIHKMALDDDRLKIREIKLGTKCAVGKWVPRLFTMEQKQRRDDVSNEFLTMLRPKNSQNNVLNRENRYKEGEDS